MLAAGAKCLRKGCSGWFECQRAATEPELWQEQFAKLSRQKKMIHQRTARAKHTSWNGEAALGAWNLGGEIFQGVRHVRPDRAQRFVLRVCLFSGGQRAPSGGEIARVAMWP